MIEAIYFDGQTTRRHSVTVVIQQRIVALRGDGIRRNERLSRLKVSERLQHAPRILRFRDGAFLEISDPTLPRLLRKNGYREPWVVRWQRNWPLSLGALLSVLALLISAYQWGLPWAVDKIAQRLPPSLEKKIGDEGGKMMDDGYLKPSKLDPLEQARLQGLFAGLKQPHGDKTSYRLEFRDSRIGPNAFALPNGVIVMTDQLVRAAANDQAVLGVLAHELGHLQRRHTLRNLLQTAGVGVMLNLVAGDVTSMLTAVPTVLLNMKYSRDFEREADQYAIDMMRVNQLKLSPMADMFEKMHAHKAGKHGGRNESDEAADKDADTRHDDDDDETPEPSKDKKTRNAPPDYLSSHPSDEERMKTLRAADGK